MSGTTNLKLCIPVYVSITARASRRKILWVGIMITMLCSRFENNNTHGTCTCPAGERVASSHLSGTEVIKLDVFCGNCGRRAETAWSLDNGRRRTLSRGLASRPMSCSIRKI